MRLTPSSYNDFLFQQQGKVSSDFQIPYDWNIGGISTSEIQRSQNFPLRVAKNYTGAIKVININLLDVDVTRDTLITAMDIFGEEQSKLIATDEFGRAWYVNADFVGLTEDTTDKKTAAFGAVFAVDDPVWKKLVPSSQTIEVVGGIGSGTLIPIGNQSAFPVIKITSHIDAPDVPPEEANNSIGFAYRSYMYIINRSGLAMTNYPIDITDGGFDTATLIGDGKMLADGSDLRVFVDGVEVKRWFGGGGINSASTTIWINHTAPALRFLARDNSYTDQARYIELGGDISDVDDVTEIVISSDSISKILLAQLPISGRVMIDSEIFVYTGVDLANLKLTGVTRAERQSTAAAHVKRNPASPSYQTDTPIFYIAHDIWLYHGNPTIESYVDDDTYKPLIDLVDSTNATHIYDGEFYDAAEKRTAAWRKGTDQPELNARFYTATENASANPASVVGIWTQLASVLWWHLDNPVGVDEIVSITGKKRFIGGNFYAFLRAFIGGSSSSFNIFVESAPTPSTSWVSLDTHTSIDIYAMDLVNTAPIIVLPRIYGLRLYSYGFTGTYTTPENAIEFDYVELNLSLPNIPIIGNFTGSGGGTAIFNPYCTMNNDATGYSLEFDITLNLDQYVIIDTGNKKITLYDGTNMISILRNMEIRLAWFPLLPGIENYISVLTDGDLTIEITWEDRYI